MLRYALAALMSLTAGLASAQQPKGAMAFGPDQTIADVGKLEWAPLKLDGFAPGIEISVLRGDLAKGGAEISFARPRDTSCRVIAIPATKSMSGCKGTSPTLPPTAASTV